jgi:RNA polymerase sigma-70 factor (ECF subfamily)
LRRHWWAAVAQVARSTGDLATAEDAVQEACVAALRQWPDAGTPADPRAWLIGTALHKARDQLRREARRPEKEAAAVRELGMPSAGAGDVAPEDQLALIFLCCHPALDPTTRIAITLRAVCGLDTTQIAAVLLMPEPTVAKRLVRARQKIRDSVIPLAVPANVPDRLGTVLRVIYLVFTEGHRASTGPDLVRTDLCDMAVTLARTLSTLLPDEPEAAGLLALLLLTDARRAARTDAHGDVVLLAEQDRGLYDTVAIAEGEALLERALRRGRPGPYQIQAAIAACHSTAMAADTDWREIAALYGELLRYEPNPVHEANRAIAVAMTEGPAAGLVILDSVAHHPKLARWPALHIARANLLHRLGRVDDAVAAYRTALEFDPGPAERAFVHRKMGEL